MCYIVYIIMCIQLCPFTNTNAIIATIFTVSSKRWAIAAALPAHSVTRKTLKKSCRLSALSVVSNHARDAPEKTASVVNSMIFKK